MSHDEKARSSVDAARDTALPTLPTVNPDAPTPKPNAPASFHPAVYVGTWIALSSSTIVFNKYILDTAKFRTSQPPAAAASNCNHERANSRCQTSPSSSQHGI
jgi:hypothetical protein